MIDNTRRAFNRGIAIINRAPSLGEPEPNARYIAPADRNNLPAAYNSQWGLSNLVLYGPHFTRFEDEHHRARHLRVPRRISERL